MSYQAWKRGWKVLYEPDSVVHHRSHATIGPMITAHRMSVVELRNKFFFTWKNLSDPALLYHHLRMIVRVLVSAPLPGHARDRFTLGVLLKCLPRLPMALSHRWRSSKLYTRTDREIFSEAANKVTSRIRFEQFLNADGFDSKGSVDGATRVLLIDPPGYQKGLNVGLAYLAASLKASGIKNVEILDLNNVFIDIPHEKIVELLKKRSYDVIGYSIKTPTYNAAIELARMTKREYPQAVHVAGGPHITLNYREFFADNPEFDYLVVGEGEFSFVELALANDKIIKTLHAH